PVGPNDRPAGPYMVVNPALPVCPPQTNGRGGAGIFLHNAHKGKVQDNLVECFGYGIYALSSTGDADEDDQLTHNLLQDNSSGAAPSAAIFLDASSGWLVTRNTITSSGFNDSGADSAIVLSNSNNNWVASNKTDNNF